jgi:hypothetical protein
MDLSSLRNYFGYRPGGQIHFTTRNNFLMAHSKSIKFYKLKNRIASPFQASSRY